MKRAIAFLLLIVPVFVYAQEEEIPVAKKYTKEVKRLTKSPLLQQAFRYIEETDEQTIEDLITLTEIPAPPFKEEKRAEAFKSMLEEIGVDSAWIDEVGNVLALRKGKVGNKTVALDAHLDTVFPEGTNTKVKISGDTLFAPGVGDDTRGLSMVLAMLRAMNEYNIETEADILFIGTVGEEGLGDLRGVKHLFSEQGPEIDAWIAIDGGDLGRVNYKGLGSHRYRVTFRGPGGHSWGAFGLGNPHHALGATIKYFVDAADAFTDHGAKTSYNVGRIGGGTSVNSIPFESAMEIDMRSLSPVRLDSMDIILEQAVQKGLDEQNRIRREGNPVAVKMEMIGNRPSGELSPDLPLIQRALAALEPFETEPRITRGSTNSNTPIALGIPAVTIGRGGEGQWAHSLLEWWANKDGHKSIQYALLVLMAESGMASDS